VERGSLKCPKWVRSAKRIKESSKKRKEIFEHDVVNTVGKVKI
jgi:hypothetical protein